MRKSRKLQWAIHQKRWFGKWHLYLGIIAGALLCIIGLTGSILVFQDEIDAALNKDLLRVMATQKKYSLEASIPLVQDRYPDLNFDYAMYVDRNNPNASYRFYDLKNDREFFINPYDLTLCGKRITSSSFVRVVMGLHRQLLLPPVGRYIVALATLCLLILTISGLRLWIPARLNRWKQWKSVLTVNFRSGWKRQNFDWHNVLGFYSSPVIILLSITGFAITFSTVFIAFLFLLTGNSPQSVASIFSQTSDTTLHQAPLHPERVAKLATQALPQGRVEGIAIPDGKAGVYRIDMRMPGTAHTGGRAMLTLDQYSGKLLLNSEKDFPNIGNSYLGWLVPLHYGTFGGMPTRILACLGGLIPLLLYITGFIIWWPRYRKQKGKQRKGVDRNLKKTTGPEALPQSLWSFFKCEFRKGLKYGGILLLCCFLSGALYGLISGIWLEPAVFSVLYCGICILINFIIALLAMVINLLFFVPFESGRILFRYAAYSLALALVFLPALLLIANSGLTLF
ncbi:hypothetical protein GCM10027051_05680 [Niabella terrae]